MWHDARSDCQESSGHAEAFSSVQNILSKLNDRVNRRKYLDDKDVELLSLCQQITRLLSGGRMTCCKSGKDRTSMSATLEMISLLSDDLSATEVDPLDLLSVLRRRGVRRQNVIKNIGRPYFAFNQIQWMNLPKMYRPPSGCYGGGHKS
jgi:inositol polyphosphate-4-phosphatase